MRLLIQDCSFILDLAETRGFRTDESILIDGSRIVQVGAIDPDIEVDFVIDGRDRLVMPGLINAHTHSPENYVRATAEALPLEPWLTLLYGITEPYTPRDHYLCCMLGAIEMLRSGVTGTLDHFWMVPRPTLETLDAGMQAYRDVGLRAGIAPLYRDALIDVQYGHDMGFGLMDTLYGHLNDALPSLPEMMAIHDEFFQHWHGAENGRLTCYTGPSGIQWASETLLHESLAQARHYGSGMHLHLMETRLQDWAMRKRFGKTAVAWMAEQGLLGPDVSLAHAVWITDQDVDLIAEHGACVVHNPAANLKLGSGLAPIRKLLEAGATVAIGTDGSASSDNQVLFEALRLAALIHNPQYTDPARWITARDVVRMATEGGARTLLHAADLGQIAPGYLADLTLLDLTAPNLTPFNDPLKHLAYCETGASVHTVIVNGTMVVDDGQLTTIDVPAILAEVRERAARRAHHKPVPPDIAEAVERFLNFQQHVLNNLGESR